jgi:hypothetical protein
MGPNTLFTSAQSLELLRNLLDVPGARMPRAKLELVLLDTLFKYAPRPKPADTAKSEEIHEVSIAPLVEQPLSKQEVDTIVHVVEAEPSELWQETLAQLKTKYNTLYSIARMGRADLVDNTLSVVFKFPFHFKRMNDDKNKRILAEVIHNLGHSDMVIQITLSSEETYEDLPVTPSKPPAGQDLTTINNIFGGHEVLES